LRYGGKTVETLREHKGKAIAGAAATLAGGIPLALGVGLGAAFGGKKLKSFMDKKRKKANMYRDGELKDADGKTTHKEVVKKDDQGKVEWRKFFKTDSAGDFTKNGEKIKKEDILEDHRKGDEDEKESKKAWSDEKKNAYIAFSSAGRKGNMLKQAAADEKVSKAQAEFADENADTLHRLLDMEQNASRKMAIALTLGIKNGFKEASQVRNAKEALGGNELLLKKFNDEMNKRNMVMNNTRGDGSLDEAKISKLVSSGKAKWEDQEWKNMTSEGIKLMARDKGPDFHKTIEKSMKTGMDKQHATEKMHKLINHPDNVNNFDSESEIMSIRKSYAASSSDFLGAFNIKSKEKYDDIKGSDRYKALASSIEEARNPKVFAAASKDTMNNSVYQQAMADNTDISMMRQIEKNADMGGKQKKKYFEMAQRNEDLKEKMANDNVLKTYVKKSSTGNNSNSSDQASQTNQTEQANTNSSGNNSSDDSDSDGVSPV